MKDLCQANTNQKKVCAINITKIDFEAKIITRYEETLCTQKRLNSLGKYNNSKCLCT